jgi:hypothetical protein
VLKKISQLFNWLNKADEKRREDIILWILSSMGDFVLTASS